MKEEKDAEQMLLKREVCLHMFSTVCLLHLLATPVRHFCPAFFIGTLVRQSEIYCHFTLLRGT